MSIFKQATRQKMRFQTTRGVITTEDLWELNLNQLNTLAKSLKKNLKQSQEDDFLEETPAEDKEIKLQFDVVLEVLETKKAERKAEREEAEKKVKREKILGLLAKKQDEALESKSEEELLKELEALS